MAGSRTGTKRRGRIPDRPNSPRSGAKGTEGQAWEERHAGSVERLREIFSDPDLALRLQEALAAEASGAGGPAPDLAADVPSDDEAADYEELRRLRAEYDRRTAARRN